MEESVAGLVWLDVLPYSLESAEEAVLDRELQKGPSTSQSSKEEFTFGDLRVVFICRYGTISQV
jgi:hypothetical protein